MCECFIQWRNRVRSMTFGFGFCSVLYGVVFDSVRVLAHLFLLLGSGWVRFKTGFWFHSFLLGSGSFPALITVWHQAASFQITLRRKWHCHRIIERRGILVWLGRRRLWRECYTEKVYGISIRNWPDALIR